VLYAILASFHETLPKPLVYWLLTLGLVLVLAAIIGKALELRGISIPTIDGTPRQVVVGVVGVLLVFVAVWAMRAQAWADRLEALESAIDSKSVSARHVNYELDRLAADADHSLFRNGRLCDFIYDYNEPLPREVKDRIAPSSRGSIDPTFACYHAISTRAVADLNNTQAALLAQHASSGTPAQAPATAPTKTELTSTQQNRDASVRIVKAATQAGQTGWVYLGKAGADSALGDRTIFERYPNEGQLVTTTTDVKLHDPQVSAGPLASSPIVGIISRGSLVKIEQLRTTPANFVWAKVSLVRNADTGQTSQAGGTAFNARGCPMRTDPVTDVRSNDMLWIVAGNKAEDSDRLSEDANIDAYCVPRAGETVTIVKPTVVYKGWDPVDMHVPGHNPLTPTDQTLPSGTRVEIVAGLGGVRKGNSFDAYLPIKVVTPGTASASATSSAAGPR
jgi:hypothetical protein